jgi:hypothetical protein
MPERFFSPDQYIIGDTAYKAHPNLVPRFKKPRNRDLDDEHQAFNAALASVRVVSEHTIGILKGRFQALRQVRIKLTDSLKLTEIVRWTISLVIIHNLLVTTDDASDLFDADETSDDDLSPTNFSSSIVEDTPTAAEQLLKRQGEQRRFLLLQEFLDTLAE